MTCHWRSEWQFGMYIPDLIGPLCSDCMDRYITDEDGLGWTTCYWWPNAHDRLELLLRPVTPLPERCVRLTMEFACSGWTT